MAVVEKPNGIAKMEPVPVALEEDDRRSPIPDKIC
jgi:hypothetical protein